MKLGPMLLGALLGLVATDVAAQTPAPWMGTWKLDPARSRFDPAPGPKSQVVTNTPGANGGYDNVAETVTADGKSTRVEYYARPDGKEYPAKGGAYDTIWVRTVDDHNNVWETRKGGKVVNSGKTSYSKDGKTRTLTVIVVDDKGKKHESVLIYGRL